MQSYDHLKILCKLGSSNALPVTAMSRWLYFSHNEITLWSRQLGTKLRKCFRPYTRGRSWIYNFFILTSTGVWSSVVIIDRLLRQCCFVWSEIVGRHSSCQTGESCYASRARIAVECIILETSSQCKVGLVNRMKHWKILIKYLQFLLKIWK